MSPMRIEIQFSVFLVNKPGVLAQITSALAGEKINVIALTLVDSQEHGVLRVVSDDSGKTRQVLSRLNLPMNETEVLCLELPNQPGALSDVATLLGKNHININYAYCTSGAPGGKTTGIFKVADQNKARHVLKGSGAKHKETAGRRTGARR